MRPVHSKPVSARLVPRIFRMKSQEPFAAFAVAGCGAHATGYMLEAMSCDERGLAHMTGFAATRLRPGPSVFA